jgi:chorismate mutase/prephenate dehydratase
MTARRTPPGSAELARLRAEIDDLDRRIVRLMNERAELTVAVGHEKAAIGRRAIRDREREREVLLRVTMANEGPIPQADLLAIYRRLIASARALEAAERERLARGEDDGPAEPPGA